MLRLYPRLVRSIAIVLVSLSLTVTVLAATPPSFGSSMLVIFPFRVVDGMDPGLGAEFGTKLGTAITNLGGVKVVVGDRATAPAAYLSTAKADGADYYLIGLVGQPRNETAPVIEQLVSVRSGVIVWSGNADIRADLDVQDQGTIIKTALLAHAGRAYVSILDPVSEPSGVPPSAAKKRNANGAGRGSDAQVAGRPLPVPSDEPRPKPTAQPKGYASVREPSRFVVLEIVGPTVASEVREYAVSSLIAALERRGQTVAQANPTAAIFPALRGPNVCAQTGGAYLVFGSIEAQVTPASSANNFIGWATAELKAVAYDCQNQKFVPSAKPLRASGSLLTTAIDRAADAAVTNYLLKVVAAAKV
jgi:hypothetical protein